MILINDKDNKFIGLSLNGKTIVFYIYKNRSLYIVYTKDVVPTSIDDIVRNGELINKYSERPINIIDELFQILQ